VSVKTCDEKVAQENDQLKLEVKGLEKMVSELVKQAKVRPPRDNHRNMMNNLEKGSNFTKQASQQSRKAQLLKKQENPLKKKSLNMQEVHTRTREDLTSRMVLVIRWEISITQW
jgi:hypothetical protein